MGKHKVIITLEHWGEREVRAERHFKTQEAALRFVRSHNEFHETDAGPDHFHAVYVGEDDDD